MSEYNRGPRGQDEAREYSSPSEFCTAEEGKNYSEDGASGEALPQSKKRRKGATALTRILTSFAAVAVVAVAVSASGMFADKVSAEIVDVAVTDTAVDYSVNVGEGDGLSVVLYNDFTRREAELAEGENTGVFTGLKPGVSYTLAVVGPAAFGSERTVVKRNVKTDILPPVAPVSVWYGVTHGCTCSVDGCFHFTMDFDDPNGYFTDFSAKLKDSAGNVSYCVFTDDLHAEQSIDVTIKAGLLGKTAVFTLTYRTSDPSASSQTAGYSVAVKI